MRADGRTETSGPPSQRRSIGSHRTLFHRVRSEGGRVEFFIGWFMEHMTGEQLDADLLARAGDLSIDLSLNLYPGPEPQKPSGSEATADV